MQTKKRSTLLIIVGLILATLAVMGLSSHAAPWMARRTGGAGPDPANNAARIRVTGRLVQDKILQGADGRVSLALTLKAPEDVPAADDVASDVDLVVVLDRSGSMNGPKIHDAPGHHAVGGRPFTPGSSGPGIVCQPCGAAYRFDAHDRRQPPRDPQRRRAG